MSLREAFSLSVTALAVVIVFAHPSGGHRVPPIVLQEAPIELDEAAQRAGLSFDQTTVPADRQEIVAAIGRARPEAQRLVGLVDGLVDVRVDAPSGGAIGTTQRVDDRFEVVLDLGTAVRLGGQAGIDRLVLHELGHVIDSAVVPPAMRRDLFAQLASGYGCRRQGLNECAEPEEQFAETFAKWATGNVGVNVYMGYATPLPRTSLDEWARPLAQLAV